MKTGYYLSPLALVLAGGIAAQSLSDLPGCGQTCIANMINQGPDLGCPATDNGRPAALCLCGRAGFGYGLRDCSRQACGPSGADADDAVSGVLAFGRSYCEEALASAASAAGGTTPSTSLAALSIFSSEGPTTTRATATDTPSTTTGTTTGSETTTKITTVSSDESTTATVSSTLTSTSTSGDESSSSSTESEGETSSGSSSSTPVTTVPVVSTVTGEDGATRTTTVGRSTVFSTSTSQAAAAAGAGAYHYHYPYHYHQKPVVTGLAAVVAAGAFML